MDVRFNNGTRQYATLEIAWVPANSRLIQESVEKIAGLVTGRRTVKESYESLFGASKPAPEATELATDLLKEAWVLFGMYKIAKNQIRNLLGKKIMQLLKED